MPLKPTPTCTPKHQNPAHTPSPLRVHIPKISSWQQKSHLKKYFLHQWIKFKYEVWVRYKCYTRKTIGCAKSPNEYVVLCFFTSEQEKEIQIKNAKINLQAFKFPTYKERCINHLEHCFHPKHPSEKVFWIFYFGRSWLFVSGTM